MDILEYPGEELDPYYRWYIPLHKERRFLDCGTLAAQVRYVCLYVDLATLGCQD